MNRYVSIELRRFVTERANFRCEYCLFPQQFSIVKFHIEHIVPMKHGGKTAKENLALACPDCNEFKGSDVGSFDWESDNKFVFFFNPRTQVWTQNFQIIEAEITSLTPEARVTARIFRFNSIERIEERFYLTETGDY
jgi:hypothetical protein